MNLISGEYTRFAGLFFVQTFSRGILLSVIPLQALALMENAQRTSTLFFVASIAGILTALGIPKIISKVGTYPSFLCGSALMFVSAVLLSFEEPVLFVAGLFFHVSSVVWIEITFTLYVLARIPRRELTRFEPLRMFASILALTIGPVLGVFLEQRLSHVAPFVVSAVFVVLGILYFRMLGMHRVEIRKPGSRDVSPLQFLKRFAAQPRLRLAYGLTMARSCWWAMFVIYVPIYAVESGLGELAGAAIVSLGTAWTLTVPFWGWVGRKYGVRKLLAAGFVTTSMLTLLVYGFTSTPAVASVLLVISAFGATMLDGMGNILFFRAVHGREQSEMAAVFSTYRDLSQLATPGVYAILLKVFALPVVFLGASVWMLVASWYCRYIPGRMR